MKCIRQSKVQDSLIIGEMATGCLCKKSPMDCIFPKIEADLHLPSERDGALWRFVHPDLRLDFHHHRELELNLVTQGEAIYLLDDRRYALRPGALVWLFPEQDHILLHRSSDFAMWILVVQPSTVARLCAGPANAILCEANPTGAYCKSLNRASIRRLDVLFEELFALTDEAHFNAGIAYALLSAWSAFTAAHDPQGDECARCIHPAIDKTVRQLREDTEPTSLKQLAAQFGLSMSRLSALFNEQTGVPLARFRNQQRLERFLRLRAEDKEQQKTLLELALVAGFGSYAQFYRVFREQMQCSPAEYPRQADNNWPAIPQHEGRFP